MHQQMLELDQILQRNKKTNLAVCENFVRSVPTENIYKYSSIWMLEYLFNAMKKIHSRYVLHTNLIECTQTVKKKSSISGALGLCPPSSIDCDATAWL